MTSEMQIWLLCSVNVILAYKLSLQELNQLMEIDLLTSGFPEIFGFKQDRRQDLAAGEPKTRRMGQKLERGLIFKIVYWMNAATRGPNVKWGHRFQMGGLAPLVPRWQRP